MNKKLITVSMSTLLCLGSQGAEIAEWELLIPAVSDPLVEEFEFAPVRSFDGQNVDELAYILRSQETGYYPNWGFVSVAGPCGYYITGVTHGQVNSERIDLIEPLFFDLPQNNIPEPSTLTVLGLGAMLLLRRRR